MIPAKLNYWLRSEALSKPMAQEEGVEEEPAGPSWDHKCFYASPIRDPGTEERQHSDAFLEHLVEPALEIVDPRMEVVRSDRLASSPITAEIYKHVVCSRLMIADLSYHNANVLLEIGLRIAFGKPCVFISRDQDEIPFDLRDERVVVVGTSEFWRFQAEIESRRDEIADQSRWALGPEGRRSGPLQRLFPNYRDYLD